MAKDWRQIAPGVWSSKEAAPQAGTVITRERLLESFWSLNTPWPRSQSVVFDPEYGEPEREVFI